MGTTQAPPGAEIYSFNPPVSLATENVQPPGNLLVTTNDQLVYQVISSSAAYQARFFVRLLRPDGTVSQFQTDLSGNGLRTSASNAQSLADGFLLSVTATNLSSNAPRGGMLVRAILFRAFPLPAQQIWNQVLFSGYCTLYDVIGWPPGNVENSRNGQGNLRSITGTTPAAGAEINEVVPAGAIWRLSTFRYTLQTSAQVASRTTHLIIDDSANVLVNMPAQQQLAASSNNGYGWYPSGVWASGDNQVFGPIPVQLFLPTGWRIRTLTSNLQTADQYSAPQYLVEEWLGV